MSPTVETYECRVLLCPETEGDATGFYILALDLPGTVSQGETEEEALAQIQDALQCVIAVYRESGDVIPWEPVDFDPVEGAKEFVVRVQV